MGITLFISLIYMVISGVTGIMANPGEQESRGGTGRIICFGNSITSGLGVEPDEAYPALLESRIRNFGKDYSVVNAGLSGETSAGGLNRIEWILKQPCDIFILELGGNDGLRGLPPDQTLKNLQSIIDRVKLKYPDAEIVLAGMKVPPNMGEDYTASFNKIFPSLAKKNNLILIPFILEGVGGNPELNQADGIHPTAEGHRIICDLVFRYIREIL
ncbi:MAG TPA: arylesterase [Cyclobacteriaceae bacterium]|nr:arylesterase [Cyclobacteriaceae bacterium]